MRGWIGWIIAVLAVGALVVLFTSINSTDAPNPLVMVGAVVGFPALGIGAMVWVTRRQRGDDDSPMPLRGRW